MCFFSKIIFEKKINIVAQQKVGGENQSKKNSALMFIATKKCSFQLIFSIGCRYLSVLSFLSKIIKKSFAVNSSGSHCVKSLALLPTITSGTELLADTLCKIGVLRDSIKESIYVYLNVADITKAHKL